MKTRAIILVLLAVLLAACSAEMRAALQETQENGAHFASWSHMGYSLTRATPQATTKEDIQRASSDQCLPNQTCKWWGEVVRVEPIQ